MHNFFNMMFFYKLHHFKRHIEHFSGHGQVLTALLQKGSMAQNELLEIVAGETLPLSKILSELEKQKLIKRGDNDVVSLTKRGKHFAQRVQEHNRFILNMSDALSNEEKDQFAAILEKLRANTSDEEFSHFHFRGSHFGFDGRRDK
jgi:DNA-binding MarR family transcriptional regulator